MTENPIEIQPLKSSLFFICSPRKKIKLKNFTIMNCNKVGVLKFFLSSDYICSYSISFHAHSIDNIKCNENIFRLQSCAFHHQELFVKGTNNKLSDTHKPTKNHIFNNFKVTRVAMKKIDCTILLPMKSPNFLTTKMFCVVS